MSHSLTNPNPKREGANQARHLMVNEPTERAADAIYVHDEDDNDIATFFHSEHATVGQSYETALRLATMLVEANNGGGAPSTGDPVRAALAWYGEQARLARLIHREGDSGRHALADDGGKRAAAALASQPPKAEMPAGVGKALDECADAIAFMDRVRASSPDEQVAVGIDHHIRVEAACRRAAAVAALAHPQQGGERVRHVKRGTEYEVLGEAEGQVSEGKYRAVPKGNTTGDGLPSRLVHDGIMLTIYRCEKTGKLWYRFPDEFRDGRFVPTAPTSPSKSSGEEA